MTEREIIKGCKKGNNQAYRRLLDDYAPMLLGVCQRYMKDPQNAEDQLQETCITIFRSIGKYRGDGAFAGWLRRIAVTTCLKSLRQNRIETETLEIIHDFRFGDDDPEVELKLNEKVILDIIGELPEHYRLVFNLSIVEGYSHDEIAELLKIKTNTSRARLARARALVQELITKKNLAHEAEETRKIHSK